jgi:hypothetical protein
VESFFSRALVNPKGFISASLSNKSSHFNLNSTSDINNRFPSPAMRRSAALINRYQQSAF